MIEMTEAGRTVSDSGTVQFLRLRFLICKAAMIVVPSSYGCGDLVFNKGHRGSARVKVSAQLMLAISSGITTWVSPDQRNRVLRAMKGKKKEGSFPTRGPTQPSE